MALGSTPGGVARLVLSEGMLIAGAGLLAGVAVAVALRAVIQSQIYGVSPLEPRVLMTVAAMLATVALVASLVPVRRAMLVDPVTALNE